MRKQIILMVDDSKMQRKLMHNILTDHGYDVKTAASGREALNMYKNWGEFIDIVLLDLSMPDMSGEETMQRLISLDPNAKVIVVSGYANKVSRLGVLSKVKKFVGKPYQIDELLTAVNLTLVA